jgi:superfamily II DNA/RNA helicase
MSQSFSELGVSPRLTQALEREGIREPFAIQRLVIGDVLAGEDVLAKAPTGSGKTLAFTLPLIDRIDRSWTLPCTLVLAPTRELAAQIAAVATPFARARNLRVAAVYGGAGIQRQAKLAARANLLVATPGRLLDLMGRGSVALDGVRQLVLDEADRMLDMGFRPDIDRIISAIPKDRQTLFFSATLDGEAGRIAASYTRAPKRHELRPAARGRVEHRFLGVSHETKLDALVDQIGREDGDRTLVFVRTKRGADRLAQRLGGRGVSVGAMHGNKSQPQRMRALAAFDAGRIAALVATDVAARGIDVDGITRVVNYDPPHDHQAYVHRVGRTARAGRSGVGVTLVTRPEAADVAAIARRLDLATEFAAGGFSGAGAPSRRRRGGSHGRRRRQSRGVASPRGL